MKKLLYSLLTLAAALTVASCQKEQPVDPYQDGETVNASFSVYMGDAMTKAFADGTTVDTVDAALYEIGGSNDAPKYTFIAQADPAKIENLKATVEINGKLKKGKYYRVVFWASKKAAATGSETAATTGADAGGTTAAASPYKVVWDSDSDSGPVVTVTPTGAANDESRDAFFGTIDTGLVEGDISPEKAIPLVRPFAQVNVLVPVGNIADGASVTSSMTVKQAPTVLNLITKETSEPKDYVFAVAPMKEPAFGGYAQSHKYVAMNYVLVDQDATASHYHDVAFSVTAGDDSTGDTPKSLTIPLKANVRTNIVGNIFESFGFSGGVVVTPGADEVVTTDIRIAVGTAGSSEDDPIPVSSNGEMVTFAISRDVTDETPAITYDPEGIVTATWNPRAKAIEIVPQVESGSAVVTVTFAAISKTDYAEGKVDVYVKVGSGETPTAEAPTFSPKAGEVEAGTKVTISAEEGADIYFTTEGTDPTKESTKYTADTEITINEETTVKAIAVVSGKNNSPVASAAYTIKAAAKKNVVITLVDKVTELTVDQEVGFVAQAAEEGAEGTLSLPLTWASSDAAVTVTADETSSANATVKGVSEGSATITVSFAGNDAYNEATASVDVAVSAAGGGDTPTVTTIADIRNAFSSTDGKLTDFAATFSNVIVTYVNGKNAYVEDETGGLMFYYDGVDLVAGQTLSGSATLTGTTYKNLKEITAMTKGADYQATAGATIPVTTVTLAELNTNYDTYESRRVKVAGVTNETAAKAKASVNITQGTTSFVMRIQNELSTEVPANSNFDVIGYPSIFNTDKQLNVWTYDDFTINSSGDHQTTISGMSDQNLKPGDSYTFAATTDNPNGTIVYSIESGNDVVTLEGAKVTVNSTATVGATAVIKASVAATTGYLAAEATATITVKSADDTTQEYVVEFTYSNNGGLSTTAGEQTGTLSDISVHLENGAMNATNSDIRIYKEKLMTISASSGTIKTIVITSAGVSNGPGKFGNGAPSGFVVSEDGLTGTWTGSATSVGFTATDAQVRMTSIKVTYKK